MLASLAAIATSQPKLASGLEVRMLRDGLALLDLEGETVHALNASAGLIALLCDGTRTEAELVDELASTSELSREQAERDVARCLSELRERGIVEP